MRKSLKHIILLVWLFSFTVSCFGVSVCEHSCMFSGESSTSVGAFISADVLADNCCTGDVPVKNDCCSDKDQYFKLDVVKKHDDDFSQKLVRVPAIMPYADAPLLAASTPVILFPIANSPPEPSGRQLLSLVQVFRI